MLSSTFDDEKPPHYITARVPTPTEYAEMLRLIAESLSKPSSQITLGTFRVDVKVSKE